MFFRRRLIDKGFLFDPKLKDVGDAAWVANLLGHGIRMQTIPEPLSIFTFTGENRSAGAVAAQEKHARSPYRGPVGALMRMAFVLEHRLAKALAGAYGSRDVSIDIYTLDSPDKRKTFNRRVGYKWPDA